MFLLLAVQKGISIAEKQISPVTMDWLTTDIFHLISLTYVLGSKMQKLNLRLKVENEGQKMQNLDNLNRLPYLFCCE